MCQPNFSPSQILCAIWIYYYYFFFIPLLFLTAFFTHRSTWKIDDHSLGLRFIVAATAAGREKQQHGRRVAPSMPVFSFSLHYSWNCKAIFCANLRKRLNPEKRFIIIIFYFFWRCSGPFAFRLPLSFFPLGTLPLSIESQSSFLVYMSRRQSLNFYARHFRLRADSFLSLSRPKAALSFDFISSNKEQGSKDGEGKVVYVRRYPFQSWKLWLPVKVVLL